MEGGFVLEDKPKVEKMAKDSTGASGRKMLADISNIQQKHSTLTQDKKSLPNSAIVKEKFIEQLQKENAALKKHLAEKRIIDLSGTELHKLRVTLQKMQQQNLQLAQSNSQLLAEVNSGKDRLKDMQHQLGCKNGVLIAKQMELEGKRKTKTCQTNDVKKMKVSENEEKGVCNIDKEEQCNKSRRQKSKSLGSSVRNGQDKGVGDNGSRRQSARFIKREEAKATEDLFDTDNVDLKEEEDRMQEDNNNNNNDSNCVVFVKKEEEEEEEEERRRRRSSISSRPSREAVKKIQSYKEMSINVKMRRTE